jgi:hypothetical protein
MRVEVVSIEEAPAVFLGPRGEFVELPILEVSDLGRYHSQVSKQSTVSAAESKLTISHPWDLAISPMCRHQ